MLQNRHPSSTQPAHFVAGAAGGAAPLAAAAAKPYSCRRCKQTLSKGDCSGEDARCTPDAQWCSRQRSGRGGASYRCPRLRRGPPPHLVELHHLVGGVAGKKDVVARLDHPGEAHEEQAIDAHGCSPGREGEKAGGGERRVALIREGTRFREELTAGHVGRDHLRRLLGVGQSLQSARPRGETVASGSGPHWLPTTRPQRHELTATTKPQLATGPQKWVVFGPVGLLTHEPSRVARLVPCLAALMVAFSKARQASGPEMSCICAVYNPDRDNSTANLRPGQAWW